MHDLRERAFRFATEIVKLVELLPKTTAGYAIGNQVIRSGPAIGAILEEAGSSSSYNDFVHQLRSARKEAKETLYWLKLIIAIKLLDTSVVESHLKECDEIIRILSQSIKTSEAKQTSTKVSRKKS